MRNLNMSAAIPEILDAGLRAWASSWNFEFRGEAYGLYFVRFKPTMTENKGGRYN